MDGDAFLDAREAEGAGVVAELGEGPAAEHDGRRVDREGRLAAGGGGVVVVAGGRGGGHGDGGYHPRGRDWSALADGDGPVVVAVLAVGVMKMAGDEVIGVVAVGHGFVTAGRAVRVAGGVRRAFVIRCAAALILPALKREAGRTAAITEMNFIASARAPGVHAH